MKTGGTPIDGNLHMGKQKNENPLLNFAHVWTSLVHVLGCSTCDGDLAKWEETTGCLDLIEEIIIHAHQRHPPP